MKAMIFFTALLIFPLLADAQYAQLKEYNLYSPRIIALPNDLDEISGLTYNEKDNSVYAISDDNGYIFRIPIGDPKPDVRKWEFGKTRDYEGIAFNNEKLFVLNSNGDITSFSLKSNSIKDIENSDFPFGGKKEFEILYYNQATHKLMIICKNCHDDKKNEVGSYSFDPADNKYDETKWKLDEKKIAKAIGKKNITFKPSAAAVNPVTGEVFIVSSINKLLVVTDPELEVKNVYEFPGNLYKQPEGITFTKSGDMIISNESANAGNANILFFKRQEVEKSE